MERIVLATYIRESTLWKNANAFYKATDWVKMECIFQDFSEERNGNSEVIYRVMNTETGEDITDYYYRDRFAIALTNKYGNSTCYSFDTRDEANAFFKTIMADKILGNFKKVSK